MKKTLRYLIAPILAVAILFAVLYSTSAPQKFTPILRFAVTSDTHVREDPDNDYDSRKHLAEFIRTAYAYSDAQPGYKKLDGMFFVGDNTNNGKEEEQTCFFDYVHEHARKETVTRAVMGNHEFYATGKYTATSMKRAPVEFMKYSGYDAVDAHLEIKGYHFIFLSMDAYKNGIKFSDEKLAWLERELAIAAADDKTGKNPIFVFQHEPPENTMVGSNFASSDTKLTEVLSKYPQVVDFSGHTHCAITDPRAIWQESFTALTTGSLAYLGSPIVGHPERDENYVLPLDKSGSWADLGDANGIRNAGMYYIIEVSKDSRVRVRLYDIFTDSPYGEYIYLEGIGEPDKFNMTADRALSAEKPVFSDDAPILVTETAQDRILLDIPQASCATDPVQNYRIDTYCGDIFVGSTYRLACTFYGDATPASVSAPITHLTPDTAYTLKVYAVGSWGQESEPVILTATTAPKAEAAVYRWEFDGAELSDKNGNNALTRLTGSIQDGVHNNSRYQSAQAIYLLHDRAWSIEWQSEGSWSASPRLLGEVEFSEVKDSFVLCRRKESGFISMGLHTGTRYETYGIKLSDHGIDGTAPHIFRLENHIADDGSNMVWLYVDGEEIGPMNNHFKATTKQEATSDWLSGKDFAFRYLGDSQYPIGGCSIGYMEIVECNHSGESSTCTFCGKA